MEMDGIISMSDGHKASQEGVDRLGQVTPLAKWIRIPCLGAGMWRDTTLLWKTLQYVQDEHLQLALRYF